MPLLVSQTGGVIVRFRKEHELEKDLSAMGSAFRSTYLLSYSPDPASPAIIRSPSLSMWKAQGHTRA
ncbi:MAG: hypothetical protein M3Y72_03700 [Acidobacteriota bacterium]|nr:hypothetical protein [Acidobacteriota bacterium]